MSRTSRHLWAVVMSLLLTTSLTFVNVAAQSSAASPQNKAKACNDLADKKGLLRTKSARISYRAASARRQTPVPVPLPVAK